MRVSGSGSHPRSRWGNSTIFSDAFEADEESRRLLGALDALADEQRGAVLGRVVEELDYAEVAARAGVSEQTVRTRVSRGLRRMRGLLIEGGR